MPCRPTLTPVFLCALAFWAACGFVYDAVQERSIGLVEYAAIACGFCIALALCARLSDFRRVMACVIVAAALGTVSAGGEAAHVRAQVEAFDRVRLADAVVVLLEDCEQDDYSSRALAEVHTADGRSARMQVVLDRSEAFLCSQQLRVSGVCKRAPQKQSGYLWRCGTQCVLTVSDCQEIDAYPLKTAVSMRARAIAGFAEAGVWGSVMQAIVCGYRNELDDLSVYGSFQSCGLAHMVAVSGAHLVMVCGLASSLFRSFRLPRKASVVLLIGFMVSYVIFAGMPISAIRAALMSSVGILSIIGMRRPSSMNGLGIVLFFLIGWQPHAALSVSLVLSALATAGIVVFSPLAERACEEVLRKRISWIVEPLALTISSSLTAQLYACATFGMLPIVSPLANIVCAPLLPLCCGLGLAAAIAQCVGLPIAQVMLFIAGLSAKMLVFVVRALALVPFASLPVYIEPSFALIGTAVVSLGVWVAWESLLEPRWLSAIGCASALVTASLLIPPTGDGICMVDVGQGDSFLLYSEGETLLVDTGNHDTQLIRQLAKCHVSHLDAVLVTHADDDHCGSLDALDRAVDVSTVFVADALLTCNDEACRKVVGQAHELANNVQGVSVGDTLCAGKIKAQVIWPHEYCDNGGNADSIVLLVGFDGDEDGSDDLQALFTGDAEAEQIQALLDEHAVEHVDVLKVGHHGSRNSLYEAQLSVLSPSVALIGVGEQNRYGHPAPELLSMLEAAGCTVFRTDEDGTMRFEYCDGVLAAHHL